MPERKEGVVPRLRFPEFRNAREWEVKRLGEVAEIVRGGSPRPITKYLTKSDDGLNWLKIGDVQEDTKYISSTEEKIKKCGLSKTREVFPGDLIMSNSMSFGRPYILRIRTCIHDGWIAISNINEQIERDYLYYFILSPTSQIYFKSAAAGGGVKNLNANIIKSTLVCLPSQKEQQKIADCLSSLDEVIELQAQELEALKAHKKGLMQQLFPREGETTPRLRFPEFRDAGPWEVKRLGEICSAFSGGTPSSSIKEYYGGSIPFIRSAEINQDTTELFLTEEGLKNSSAKLVVKGDILIALYGANSGDGALSKIDGAINQAILCLRSKLNHSFILAYWRLRKNEIVMRFIQGGQGNLSAEIVKSIAFAFPSLAEQQKIADCFSSLDRVIELEAQKLEAFKTHKKGLMQQLFPQEVD